ncbi:hypothetical protein BJX66DRAFT_167925 [Aspergillus keveii]|uniref:Uncharacterized protein n=1 Tax=Aspergillus keveii TaxID=714993 RepID=A0ABR4GA83_9EURO
MQRPLRLKPRYELPVALFSRLLPGITQITAQSLPFRRAVRLDCRSKNNMLEETRGRIHCTEKQSTSWKHLSAYSTNGVR